VSGTFAAADWMFSIAPRGSVSASAAASLRFGLADDDSSDDSEPPLRVFAGQQQQRVSERVAAQASPQLTAERDLDSHGASSSVALEPPGDLSEQRTAVQHAAAQEAEGDVAQPAQPARRRVSFANRLPAAARTPLTWNGADGAKAQDGARATAERVAAQVTACALLPIQRGFSSPRIQYRRVVPSQGPCLRYPGA